jgi:hypothetical protein
MAKQAFGEEAVGHSGEFKRHKCFAHRRDSLEDEEYTGRPRMIRTELRIQEVPTLVCANRSQVLDEVAAAQQGLAVVPATGCCLMT